MPPTITDPPGTYLTAPTVQSVTALVTSFNSPWSSQRARSTSLRRFGTGSTAERYKRGEEDSFTSKEFAILELFLLHADDLVTRTDILEHVWEHHSGPGSNLVDVYINCVRRKVDQNGFAKLIDTVRGMGYRLGLLEE